MKPTSFFQQYGPWALVTGGAQGLGEAFARELAQRGLNLLLVDRQAEKLAATAQALQETFGVEVHPLACDLTQPDCLEQLCALADEMEIGLLVNNAAVSTIQPFHDVPLSDHLRLVDVNIRAPLTLAHCLGQAMRSRGRGGIVFVSSASAIAGTAYVASYAASKAAAWILAEALWAELTPHGVDVLAVVAGNMDTPAWRAATPNPDAATWPPLGSPQTAAREALQALGKQPFCVVPGWQNRLVFFFLRHFFPRKAFIRLLEKTMRQRYQIR